MKEFRKKMDEWKKLKEQWAKEVNPNLPSVNLPQPQKPKKPTKKKPPLKKRGRKKIRRRFSETRLGYFLQLYAPLEYDMIMEATRGDEPNADFIESFSYSSANPFFKGKLFRSALIQYRDVGLYQEAKKPPSPQLVAKTMKKRIKAVCEHYRSEQ